MNPDLWNTFERLRPKLEQQYRSSDFPADTGISQEELRRLAEEMVRNPAGDSRITLRARLLELLLTRARVSVDPEDWFADRLDAGELLVEIREQWRSEAARTMPDIIRRCDANIVSGLSRSQLNLSHTSPDC